MTPAVDLFKVAQLVTDGPAFRTLRLVHRLRPPRDEARAPGPFPALVLVHGHQGTEDVPWIFARGADPNWLIVSPRAPSPASSGFTWYNFQGEDPEPESFHAGLAALTRFVDELPAAYPVDPARLVLLGFSQGAAMSYAYALSANRTASVSGVVALGGYIPVQVPNPLPPLNGLPCLVLHGTRDEAVEIECARQARDRLTQAGARVTYQEMDIGHKVDAAGLRTLTAWLHERLGE
jgi:phospholipase/carboxylesterase